MNWEQRRAALQGGGFGRLFLGAASAVYAAGVWIRRLLYEARVFKRHSLQAKVICIGNLTTGGTGKTPAVLLAARTLRQRSHNVAVLTRGYGRPSREKEVLVLLDDNSPDWRQSGDEPWMMRNALKGLGVPILVSPDRVLSGTQAVNFYHSRALILDDGFQHLRLKRDLDVLMINALDPFGGRRLLPLGNLREPLGAVRRAHMIILTHVDWTPAAQVQAIKDELHAINPRLPILESIHKSDFLFDLKEETRHPLDVVKGQEVVVFSAIADPASFRTNVDSLGAKVIQEWRYPDHHPYSLGEIQSLDNMRRGLPALTTFKDLPRLPPGWKEVLKGDVYALAVKLEIIKGMNIWVDTLCAGL